MLTLSSHMDCSSVHGISEARILEGLPFAMSSSRGSSWPRDRTRNSCISGIGRQILYPREALHTACVRPISTFSPPATMHSDWFQDHHVIQFGPMRVSSGLGWTYCNKNLFFTGIFSCRMMRETCGYWKQPHRQNQPENRGQQRRKCWWEEEKDWVLVFEHQLNHIWIPLQKFFFFFKMKLTV